MGTKPLGASMDAEGASMDAEASWEAATVARREGAVAVGLVEVGR